jgi:hypothetical protein
MEASTANDQYYVIKYQRLVNINTLLLAAEYQYLTNRCGYVAECGRWAMTSIRVTCTADSRGRTALWCARRNAIGAATAATAAG